MSLGVSLRFDLLMNGGSWGILIVYRVSGGLFCLYYLSFLKLLLLRVRDLEGDLCRIFNMKVLVS